MAHLAVCNITRALILPGLPCSAGTVYRGTCVRRCASFAAVSHCCAANVVRAVSASSQASRQFATTAHEHSLWQPKNVPPDAISPQVIYLGPLAKKMKLVKMFSLITSTLGFMFIPVLQASLAAKSSGLVVFNCAVIGAVAVATPLLLHMVVKNYVLAMRYDPLLDRYTAETYSLLLRRRKTKFKAHEVVIPETEGMFSTFMVRGRSFFVDSSMVDPIEHYGRLMKYEDEEKLSFLHNNSNGGSSSTASASSASSPAGNKASVSDGSRMPPSASSSQRE